MRHDDLKDIGQENEIPRVLIHKSCVSLAIFQFHPWQRYVFANSGECFMIDVSHLFLLGWASSVSSLVTN